jgi:MFS family permease
MWLIFLPALLFGSVSVLGPLRLDVLGVGAAAIGATFLVSAGLEAVLSPVLGRLTDRRGTTPVLVAASIASAAVSLLLPWPDRAWVLAALVVCAAMAYGAFWVPAMALLSQGAERSGLEQSIAFALMNLAWAAGQGLGSLSSGALGEQVGDALPYTIGAVLCLTTLVVLSARARTAPEQPRSQVAKL